MNESKLHVSHVGIVPQSEIRWRDGVNSSIRQLLLNNVNEMKLRSNSRFSVAVERNFYGRIEIGRQVHAVPGYWYLRGVPQVYL